MSTREHSSISAAPCEESYTTLVAPQALLLIDGEAFQCAIGAVGGGGDALLGDGGVDVGLADNGRLVEAVRVRGLPQ